MSIMMPVCIGGLESDENGHTFTEITGEQGRLLCGDIIKGLCAAGSLINLYVVTGPEWL